MSNHVRDNAMTVQAITGFQPELSAMRRGTCPTLARPMPTGDGLLARLRPEDCRLTPAQLRALALAAAEHGNGILEVTARGSLQIRGLRPETVAPFEAAVLATDIVIANGVMVEVPPLSGIDPEELIDPLPVADKIRRAITAREPKLLLAPKLAIVVDGGGQFHLGAVTADVRLMAIDRHQFLLAVGGTNASARTVASVTLQEAPSAVLRALEAIAAAGPSARGKEIDLAILGDLYSPAAAARFVPVATSAFLGIRQFGTSPEAILGFAFPYRQARANDLIAFLDEIEILGLSDIRLSPGHGMILTGLHRDQAATAENSARRHGFWTAPDEPRASIPLCAGTAGCASARFDTRATAEEIAHAAPILLDGSIALHLSGCPKGCAHPSPAPLTVVGAPSGYGLVVNGAASDAPALYIAAKDLGIAMARLASLVAAAKETGEAARDCLARLGPARIVAALTLDGQ